MERCHIVGGEKVRTDEFAVVGNREVCGGAAQAADADGVEVVRQRGRGGGLERPQQHLQAG